MLRCFVDGENMLLQIKNYTNSCLTALWRSWRWKGRQEGLVGLKRRECAKISRE